MPTEATSGRAIDEAVAAILRGELIGLPTETVYGLAGDASNRKAIETIYRVKGRPTDHPLIVHVASREEAARWGVWNDSAERLAAAFWPGPLTIVLARQADASPLACAGQSTVALRVPSHPVARQLLARSHAAGIAGIAAPSANRFGRISPTRASHVRADLGDEIAIVLDGGDAQVGIESTIVDLSRIGCRSDQAASNVHGLVLRPGHLSSEQIARVLGVQAGALDAVRVARDVIPRVPGSHQSHYAPVTPLRVVGSDLLAEVLAQALRKHDRVALWSRAKPDSAQVRWLEQPATLEALEQTLYSSLRKLDAFEAPLILVERFAPIDADFTSSDPAWAGIADRLRRAAA